MATRTTTVKLFKLLLAKDSKKTIIQEAIKLNPKKQIEAQPEVELLLKTVKTTNQLYKSKEVVKSLFQRTFTS